MATWRVPILNKATIPDTRMTNGNVIPEPLNVNFGSNSFFRPLIVRCLDTSTKDGLAGMFTVPKNYVGTAKVVIVWSATVTTGNVVWDFEYRAVGGDNAESLDQATAQESVTVTDAAPTTARNRLEVSINLTSANLAADDIVTFLISRDGADAADTMTSNAYLFEVYFEYNDA